MSDRIGELLVREKLISLSQLKDAQASQRNTRESLTYTLAKLGMVGENDLTEFLSRHYGIPPVDLEDFEIDEDVIDVTKLQHAITIPVAARGDGLPDVPKPEAVEHRRVRLRRRERPGPRGRQAPQAHAAQQGLCGQLSGEEAAAHRGPGAAGGRAVARAGGATAGKRGSAEDLLPGSG